MSRNINCLLFKVGRGRILIIVRLMLISVLNWNRLLVLEWVMLVLYLIIFIGFVIWEVLLVKLLINC